MKQNVVYRKKICEICKKEAYEKFLGEELLDGGYSTLNKFEDSGYEYLELPGHKPACRLMICPTCQSAIASRINDYISLFPSTDEKG